MNAAMTDIAAPLVHEINERVREYLKGKGVDAMLVAEANQQTNDANYEVLAAVLHKLTAERDGYSARCLAAEAKLAKVLVLLNAITVTEFSIEMNDVQLGGKRMNWFDAREAILQGDSK